VTAKTSRLEGVCIATAGYEEDYLEFVELDGEDSSEGSAGITAMIRNAVGDEAVTNWMELHAFQSDGYTNYIGDAARLEAERNDFRENSDREYPALMRVKITAEVEILPDGVVRS